MKEADTSAEAVERLALIAELRMYGETAATLRALLAERDEAIATLTLYRAQNGCTRGQRTTQWCGEAARLRRAWLRVIQLENGCPASGGGCLSKQCGCVAEMHALSEYVEASRD